MKSGSRSLVLVLLAAGAAWLLAGSLPAADGGVAAFPGGNGAIAYTCYSADVANICTIQPDGTGRTQLTSGHRAFEPAWSPDGSQIAFDCAPLVCVMDADGSNWKLLALGFSPAWSPDGSRIAFGCDGICVMNADGSNHTQLTTGFDDFPSWSPDGSAIVFSRALTVGSDIYVVNADRSGLTPLTNEGGASYNDAPDWSPDGTKIAFESTRDGDAEIYVMNPGGSAVTQLTFGGANVYPAWSPDGTKIAFTHLPEPSGSSELYVMNADGSAVTALTTGDEVGQGFPDWQPLTGTPRPFSDLALRMAGPRHIGPGDPITYTIHVRNDGPARAEGVVVTDPVPAGTQLIRASVSRGSCSAPDPASGALSCSLGSMGDGSVRTIIVVCRAIAARGTAISNTATVSSSTPDRKQGDNSATVETRVR